MGVSVLSAGSVAELDVRPRGYSESRRREDRMQNGEQVWRSKTDDEVVEAARVLADYTEEGERIIRAELRRRGLPEPAAPIGRCSRCGRSIHGDDPGMECAQCGKSFPEAIRSILLPSGSDSGNEVYESGSTEFVYRSTYLHEVDLVAEQLEQAGIAFYRSAETMGVRFAMPLSAAVACLPGSWFLVVVPAPHAARARALVGSLPVSHDE